ncbi:universal stress protein [Actinoplanes sp. NPDC049681]|uniref:universal stress protein n=1 Tax=Actinoplanes sp. NPDC049681 TaxID=3363905 RepID=UPI0037B41363
MTTVAGAAVMVGVDGSPRSLDAVEVAAAEAALRRRPLRIVHAQAGRAPRSAGTADAAGENAAACLAEAVRMAGKVTSDVAVTTEVVHGRPAAALTALSRHASLLVVGDRGLGGMLFGSVPHHLASHAGCPVLVVRGEPRTAGPVVVGVDGTGDSAGAVDVAFEEASLRCTSLVALHAWCGTDGTELDGGLPARGVFRSGAAQEERVLAEALAGAADRYPEVPVRRQVVRGHAGPLLTDWSGMAQLVVVGERRHSGLPGAMLGSVSQHLIFHADCPTTVVRATAPAFTGSGSAWSRHRLPV